MGKGKYNNRLSYADTAVAAPAWAKPLFQLLESAQERLDRLDHRLENSRPNSASDGHLIEDGRDESLIDDGPSVDYEPGTDVMQTPRTPHVAVPGDVMIEVPGRTPTQRTIPLNEIGSAMRRESSNHQGTGYDPGDDDYGEYEDEPRKCSLRMTFIVSEGSYLPLGEADDLYSLRDRDSRYAPSARSERPERPLPEIPGSDMGEERPRTPTARAPGPEPPNEVTPSSQGPAFARPHGDGVWAGNSGIVDWNSAPIPSWQRVHQRLLSWAIVWSMSELERGVESTEPGHQVDECALTIWTTQCYKRYVRSRTVENGSDKVDRLFVPPNVADAINNAVYNGRHGDACSMLKDLWAPFGFEGIPRLIVVLARHRRDANHWVVHRFALHIPNLSLALTTRRPGSQSRKGRLARMTRSMISLLQTAG